VFGSLRSYRRSILSSAPPFAPIRSYGPARPVVTATSSIARQAGKTYNLEVTATSRTRHHSSPLTPVVQK